MLLRQGDVMLVRVASRPVDAVPEPAENGRAILAHGELTGHHHSVDAIVAQIVAMEGERFLEVSADTELTHQEHAPISLAPGVYRIANQREYHPAEIRRVAD